MSHDAHTQDPPERSNPALWALGLLVSATVLVLYFAYNYHNGAIIGRDHGRLPPSAASGPVEPMHQALIDARGDDVLEKGANIFAKNCATCHGPQGNTNPTKLNPAPRNFWTDAFKNPNGGGPYGLYTVVSKGFQGMPAFPSLLPEERYAVIHYVREVLVKPNNPSHYIEKDPDTIVIPAGGGAAEGPGVRPALRPVPDNSYALLAGVAQANDPAALALQAWIERSLDGAEGRGGAVLRAIVHQSTASHLLAAGYLQALARASAAKDIQAVQDLIIHPPLGVSLPEGALLTESEFTHLFAQLRTAKPPSGAGVP